MPLALDATQPAAGTRPSKATIRGNWAALNTAINHGGYFTAGTAAPERQVQAHLRDTISVKDYGAVGNATTDDTTAFEQFHLHNPWLPIYVPAGTYRLTRPLVLTRNGRLCGDGPNLSWLVWDGGDGVRFVSTVDDNEMLHVSDLTFRTKGLGGIGLRADFSAQINATNGHSMGREKQRFLLQNCVFQPGGSIFSTGWNCGFELIAGLIGEVRDCNFFGYVPEFINGAPIPAVGTLGCYFHGVGDEGEFNGRPVQFVVDGCTFGGQDCAVNFTGCEGGFVAQTNMVGVGFGITWESRWGQRPQLCVNNNHINAWRAGVAAVDCADLQVNQTLFFNYAQGQPASSGILCSGTLGCLAVCIVGNTFAGTSQTMNGVVIAKGDVGVIAHNIFRSTIGTAVWLQPGANDFHGQDNVLGAAAGSAVGLFNQGTNNVVAVV